MSNGNGAERRKAVLAGVMGHFVESYDNALYGFFATTIALVFFPKSDPSVALLSTFAIFAVSFVVRPLGGIVFGHLGDRLGRRPVLLLAISLVSGGTVAMGLIPGYAQIGVMAPVLLLLCRLVQGFSAGGEYNAANIFIVERAPYDKRGRYASAVPASAGIAPAFGALVAVLMTSTTTAEQLASWGWRVPFLMAAPLALVGLYLRLRVEESPEFSALRTEGHVESAPLMQALKVAKKPMLILLGVAMPNIVGFYLLTAFLVTYMTKAAKFSSTASLLVLVVAELFSAVCCILAGRVIDALGRKRVAVASALGLGAWAVPTFALIQHASVLGAFLVIAVFVIFVAGMSVTCSVAFVELFPAPVRSSASTLAYQIVIALIGGTAPFVATWFVGRGHLLGPGYYLAGLCAISALVAAIGIGNRPQGDSGDDVLQARDESTQQASA